MHQEPMESNAKIATKWNINGCLFSLICSVHYLYNCVFFIHIIVEAICESYKSIHLCTCRTVKTEARLPLTRNGLNYVLV